MSLERVLATPAPGTGASPAAGGRPDLQEQVRELAREFESLLILQMLRQMRQSSLSESADGEGFWGGAMTDTIDQELALTLSRSGGFGLAEAMTRGLGPAGEVRAAPAPATLARPPASIPPADPLPEAPPAAPVAARDPTGAAPGTPAAAPAVPLPLEAPLTSAFGWRPDPFQGNPRFHSGVDIRAAYGQPVPAPQSGRVVFAGEQGGYGLTVEVEHGNGTSTRYAHLSALLVAEGEAVREGQVIGRVGQTGRATGPHLHFEVAQDGRRLNPEAAARRYALLLKEVNPVADSPWGGPAGRETRSTE